MNKSEIRNIKSYFVNITLFFTFIFSLFISSCNNITDNTIITPSGNVSPINNAKLNYTQVMFEYPEIKNAVIYKVQIAENTTSDNFEKTIIIEQNDSTTATLINGLKFGKKYRWRYSAINKNGDIIYISDIFFFETLYNVHIDKNYFRYKINKKDVNDGYIFIDGTHTVINRDGEPIWFLPIDIKLPQDIKMTKSGTITLLIQDHVKGNEGCEISLNGEILWHVPEVLKPESIDSTQFYHHDFQKLNNNNYMIMGHNLVPPKFPINCKKIFFATLTEFDSNRNIVWYWDSQNGISDTDVYYPQKPKYIENVKGFTSYDIIHSNGFYYDNKNEIIYLSSKNLSRIIKIDKKSGKVILNYGDKYPSGDVKYANNFFKYQHSPLLLPNGNLAIFSNNGFDEKDTNKIPATVVVFSQPNSINDSSKIVWKFNCNFDKLYGGYSIGQGNIIYMDNSNFIVNLGVPVCRVFEVTQDKKIVWDCFVEYYSEEQNKWKPSCSYRVSYTKSLYPIYFTLNNSFNSDTIKLKGNIRDNTSVVFNINNEGSNSDKYIVKYYANNKEIDTIYTGEILPYKTKPIFINLKNLKVNQQEITVTVSSSANPQFKRELKFYIK